MVWMTMDLITYCLEVAIHEIDLHEPIVLAADFPEPIVLSVRVERVRLVTGRWREQDRLALNYVPIIWCLIPVLTTNHKSNILGKILFWMHDMIAYNFVLKRIQTLLFYFYSIRHN